MRDTPRRQLATQLLGEDVGQWLQTRADTGMSSRRLATTLAEATGGTVSVSHEAIRQWLKTAPVEPKQA